MLRTGQSPAPSMRRSSSASTPGSHPTPGVLLPGTLASPGPDSHRLAAVSLSLGYVVVPSFRWSSAPELLDAHFAGIIRANWPTRSVEPVQELTVRLRWVHISR